MWPEDIAQQANALIALYTKFGRKIATAESCTGGLIAGALTEVSGSSSVVDRGFITYSNEAKVSMLAVSHKDIETHGAVSEPVAAAMAAGALKNSMADMAISVTGVAGPTGGSPAKPVGTVWFGLAQRNKRVLAVKHVFQGPDRLGIRLDTVRLALSWLQSAATSD